MVQTAPCFSCRKSLASVTRATMTLSLLFVSFYSVCLAEANSSNSSAVTDPQPDPGTLEQCPTVDFCPLAAQCCHAGMDEYGWIAAAVGWSLLFLTLILLCVGKLMTLKPDDPKGLPS
nr:transmembrane protein 213 [Loxodonta africana]